MFLFCPLPSGILITYIRHFSVVVQFTVQHVLIIFFSLCAFILESFYFHTFMLINPFFHNVQFDPKSIPWIFSFQKLQLSSLEVQFGLFLISHMSLHNFLNIWNIIIVTVSKSSAAGTMRQFWVTSMGWILSSLFSIYTGFVACLVNFDWFSDTVLFSCWVLDILHSYKYSWILF